MNNDARESVLPGPFKKIMMLFWVFILPQSILFVLNCFSFWIIREEVLPQNLAAAAMLGGSEILLIVLCGALLFSWKRSGYLEVPSGDVKMVGVRKVWEESPVFRNLRDLSSYKGKCGGCRFLKICGGCRARAYELTSDILEEEPLCTYKTTDNGII